MFGQVPPTPYDLQFTLLGVPVRVHPIFWVSSIFLARRGTLDEVLVNVLCIFVAILVHEMGHALATRRFGWQPEIVLYFFGGYATSARHSTWKDIAVSAAGPGAGFLLLTSIWWWARTFNVVTPDSSILHPVFIGDGTRGTALIVSAVRFSLFINFVWNVVNLLPVLPLDGGQISREFCLWVSPRKGMQASLVISMLASGGVALLAFQRQSEGRGLFGLDPLFLGLMFGYLCYQSYQDYSSGRRGYR